MVACAADVPHALPVGGHTQLVGLREQTPRRLGAAERTTVTAENIMIGEWDRVTDGTILQIGAIIQRRLALKESCEVLLSEC